MARRKPLPTRICAYPPCGEEFQPRRRDARFHTDTCRHAYWHAVYQTEPHACPLCSVVHDPEEAAVLNALEVLLMTDQDDVDHGRMMVDVRRLEAFITRRRAILNASAEVETTGHLF